MARKSKTPTKTVIRVKGIDLEIDLSTNVQATQDQIDRLKALLYSQVLTWVKTDLQDDLPIATHDKNVSPQGDD